MNCNTTLEQRSEGLPSDNCDGIGLLESEALGPKVVRYWGQSIVANVGLKSVSGKVPASEAGVRVEFSRVEHAARKVGLGFVLRPVHEFRQASDPLGALRWQKHTKRFRRSPVCSSARCLFQSASVLALLLLLRLLPLRLPPSLGRVFRRGSRLYARRSRRRVH